MTHGRVAERGVQCLPWDFRAIPTAKAGGLGPFFIQLYKDDIRKGLEWIELTLFKGMNLEDFARSTILETVSEIERFLLFVRKEATVQRFAEVDKRNLALAYHRLWWFRNSLMKRYSLQEESTEYEPQLFGEFRATTERDIERMLLTHPEYETRMDLPKELGKVIGDTVDFLLKSKSDEDRNRVETHYITKDGDGFRYKGAPMNLSKKALYFKVFTALFSLLPDGGEVSYEKLAQEIRKQIPSTKKLSSKEMNSYIQGKLTENTNGFKRYAKLEEQEDNGKPLIQVIKNYGIRFNNER